jgi:hypothetical protein
VDRLVTCSRAADVERLCRPAWIEWQRDVMLHDPGGADAATQPPLAAGAEPMPAMVVADAGTPAHTPAGSEGCGVVRGAHSGSMSCLWLWLCLCTGLARRTRRLRNSQLMGGVSASSMRAFQ